MTKLRVLRIGVVQMQCEVHIYDDFKFHYDELRCLFWDHYPLKLLPSDFKCKNLVWLCMPNSYLTPFFFFFFFFFFKGVGERVFENLKYMDLSDSKYLTEAPDFSRVNNLKFLMLDGCTQLCKILPSLGDLEKLTCLSLENCINLEHFRGIGQLVSLKTLILSGCSKLEKFPDISQHMPGLWKLCLDGTAITELPPSIGYATELVRLDLKNCGKLRSLPSSICELTLLQTLSLSGCSDLGKCEVNSGNLDALPRTLDRLCSLQELELQNCRSLRALPALPSSLVIINGNYCESLEDITPQSVFSQFRSSMFGNCLKLTKFQSRMERDLYSMAARVDEEIRRPTFKEQNPEVPFLFSTVFPGSGIPDWFKHSSEGHEINIQVSQNWYASNFLGFALSAVVAPDKEPLTSGWITYCDLGCGALNSKLKSSGIFSGALNSKLKSNGIFSGALNSKWKSNDIFSLSFVDDWTEDLEHITIGSDHMWLAYVPSFPAPEKWSCIKFSFGTEINIFFLMKNIEM
ncbi:hypothetical protein PVL29_002332 [Vitis rotundifolia]|uniref:Uncharacterized protein n=1 Tax=Vitis rotundifolia TaxID=103349 RepID=A0AA39AHU9_VITRO|nr:hypothetical protein PVL29_002332 [Vitis rotundifolia]